MFTHPDAHPSGFFIAPAPRPSQNGCMSTRLRSFFIVCILAASIVTMVVYWKPSLAQTNWLLAFLVWLKVLEMCRE